jgi:hypothetical protein
VLAKLGAPQEGEEPMKKCYGRFDPGDFECASLCPLQPECEVETGCSSPSPERATVEPAAATAEAEVAPA